MDAPELCTATISLTSGPARHPSPHELGSLPKLGAVDPAVLLIGSLALLTLAALSVATIPVYRNSRNRRNGRSGQSWRSGLNRRNGHERSRANPVLTLLTAILLGAGGAAIEQPPSPALALALGDQATPPRVEYSAGCALVEITDDAPSDVAARLMPGSSSPVLRVGIANRFSSPVEVTADSIVADQHGGASAVALEHRFGVGPVVSTGGLLLAPGVRAELTVSARLPAEAGNETQGAGFDLIVLLTAKQVPDA